MTGAKRQSNDGMGRAVWGAGDDSSLPSIEGSNEEESSLPSLHEASDEASLPSVYEASDETSLPSIDEDGLGDLPTFDASPAEEEEAAQRTDASEIAGLSLLGMLLGSPAPRCVAANDAGIARKVVWEEDDGESLPSIDGAGDESSLPCMDSGDDASIPSMGGEGDFAGEESSLPCSTTSVTELTKKLSTLTIDGGDDASIPSIDGEGGMLDLFDVSQTKEEDTAQRTDASEIAGLSLLGMFLGAPAPKCVPAANDGGNARKVVWEEDDGASLPSIDESCFPFDESSLPCMDDGDDASIPSMDGEGAGTDVADLPSFDASTSEEEAGTEAYASEVASWGLLGMLLGAPAPSCVPSKTGRRRSANLWDDGVVSEDLDGVLPDCEGEVATVPASEEPRRCSDPSQIPSLSGISDDDSAEDDSLPPSMDGSGSFKDGPAAEPLSSSPNDVMAWGTLVAILSSPAPSPVRGRKGAGRAGPSLWEECDVPLPPEL